MLYEEAIRPQTLRKAFLLGFLLTAWVVAQPALAEKVELDPDGCRVEAVGD